MSILPDFATQQEKSLNSLKEFSDNNNNIMRSQAFPLQNSTVDPLLFLVDVAILLNSSANYTTSAGNITTISTSWGPRNVFVFFHPIYIHPNKHLYTQQRHNNNIYRGSNIKESNTHSTLCSPLILIFFFAPEDTWSVWALFLCCSFIIIYCCQQTNDRIILSWTRSIAYKI